MMMNMAEALNNALDFEMGRDANILIFGEDVGLNGGVFRITRDLQDRYGADRVFDTPLAESSIVGFAIGLALNGFRPIAEIQFMGFLWPALDQLSSHASRLRNRTLGRYSVPMVVRFPYGGGVRALEHHAESFEAVLAHIPGLKIVIPSNPVDAKGLLASSIRDPDPVVFMEPKRLYRADRVEVDEGEVLTPLGEADVLMTGDDITLVAWGAMVPKVIKAAELMAEKNISAEVIDLRSICPYDHRTVHESIEKTGRAVVVQEAPRTCGFASEIISRINDTEIMHLKSPVMRVTGFDVPFPFYKMEEWAIPDLDRIIKASREALTW